MGVEGVPPEFLEDEDEITLGEDEESEDSEDVEEAEDVSEDVPDEETPVEPPKDEKRVLGDEEPITDPGKPVEATDGSITGKLADETSDEIHEDVSFLKRKAKNKIVDDPDSFREKWRRARLKRHGYYDLRKLSRDPETGDFIIETTLVRFEDLPNGAVQCTNEKGVYCLDTIKESEWYQESRELINVNEYEAQFTASDAALYMQSNKIDNALITKWNDMSHLDMKKIMLPMAAVFCIALFFIIRGV